jgi:hypothetical protein
MKMRLIRHQEKIQDFHLLIENQLISKLGTH